MDLGLEADYAKQVRCLQIKAKTPRRQFSNIIIRIRPKIQTVREDMEVTVSKLESDHVAKIEKLQKDKSETVEQLEVRLEHVCKSLCVCMCVVDNSCLY